MTDLFARLELIHEALTATADSVAAGRAPGDEAERERCRRVAELLAGQGRRVVDLLATPPAPDLRRRIDGLTPSSVDVLRGDGADAGWQAALRDTRAATIEARVVAEQDRILAEASDREQGEEP